ncbi:MAG: hypothetical protein JNK42_04125, partial [Caedimonas sp.]|nr:hypothetical protein [Caedimonas sp.]
MTRKINKFLITCSFLSLMPMASKVSASLSIIENDDDIRLSLGSGFSQAISEKSLKRATGFKLSDKGDLTGSDNIGRREFYMMGDGNCALYSMGTTHAQARILFLAHANNPEVRRLAHREIVDQFHHLPRQMTVKQDYIDLKTKLDEVTNLLRELGDGIDEDFRRDITGQQDQIWEEVGRYAQTENAYKDYVDHQLVNGHYMRFREDVGGHTATYFIDALAYILNKDLTIWTQVGPVNASGERQKIKDRPDVINQSNNRLMVAHRFVKPGANGTLELIHRGNHFNRLVSVNNANALAQAARDEQAFIEQSAQTLKQAWVTQIRGGNDLMEYYINDFIVKAKEFSEEDKKQARAKCADFAKKKLDLKSAKPQAVKAYCLAAMKAYSLAQEDFLKDASIDVKAIIARDRTRWDRVLKMAPGNRRALEELEKVLKSEGPMTEKKLKALGEIDKLDHYIRTFERVSDSIKTNVSDREIFQSLNTTIYGIGQINESLQDLIKVKKNEGLVAEAEKLEQETKANADTKRIFEKLYSKYQKEHNQDIGARLQVNFNESKKRVTDYLAKNPPTRGCWGEAIFLKNDFEAAKTKLIELTQEKIRRNQPYVNPDFILYDPYLHTHNRDVNTEYPNPVTDEEWAQIAKETKKSISKYLLAPGERKNVPENDIPYGLDNRYFSGRKKNSELDKVKFDSLVDSFNQVSSVFFRGSINKDDTQKDRKHTLRKRIKRLLDALIQQNDAGDKEEAKIVAYATFGELMGQLQGRCVDGVEEGVEYFEDGLVYGDSGSTFTESKVSKIITSDKHHFIKQHKAFAHYCAAAAFSDDDDEYATGIPEMLLQRMRYALSLRGETHELLYPGYGGSDRLELFPARVMERYLHGQRHQSRVNGKMQTSVFEARTPEKLADLLYEAYERGVKKIYNQGETFSAPELVDFALADQKLKPLYEEFANGLADGEDIDSPYFRVVEKNVGYKKEFFKYILERLGYVIDPRNPSVNILSDESQRELAEAKRKAEEARKETIDQLKAVKEEIAAAKPKSASPQAQLKEVSLGDGNEREGYVREYYNADDGLYYKGTSYQDPASHLPKGYVKDAMDNKLKAALQDVIDESYAKVVQVSFKDNKLFTLN